jgi:hypothetical protein
LISTTDDSLHYVEKARFLLNIFFDARARHLVMKHSTAQGSLDETDAIIETYCMSDSWQHLHFDVKQLGLEYLSKNNNVLCAAQTHPGNKCLEILVLW